MRCPWPAIRAARAVRETGLPLEILTDELALAMKLSGVAAVSAVDNSILVPGNN